MRTYLCPLVLVLLSCFQFSASQQARPASVLHINASGYYEAPGLDVMVFDDFYPEGHQGGLTIVQRGVRVAANGDVRLEPTPGQWSPVPVVGPRRIDSTQGVISVRLWYPDSSKNRKGFNPINYPDLAFSYSITTTAMIGGIQVTVDLDKPLPDSWADRVGFNLELFPGSLFGRYYLMDGAPGMFPRQANGPTVRDGDGNLQARPLANGKELVVLPASPGGEIRITSRGNPLQLLDERVLHNNGWFVVRSTVRRGATRGAVEWMIAPASLPGWTYSPVVQASQVGYHPAQKKYAIIELDKSVLSPKPVQLVRIQEGPETVVREDRTPALWGQFLRYRYVRFDFSDVTTEGLYKVVYGGTESTRFVIGTHVYAENVWQPTLATFLPVQMCHMRVEDRYKVWHGLCHMDDAVMAPLNHNHFDGYIQGGSTLTTYEPGEHVPGLNQGGWHDAGDYDLRVESQAETVYKLSLARELFGDTYDETTINQQSRVARLHQPDGVPDLLQQIEHGVLTLTGAYESMGRVYRGIISPTLKQYVHLGDASTMSDNLPYGAEGVDPVLKAPLPEDDRLVFTEENPQQALGVAASLAAAGRVLQAHRPALALQCVRIAEDLYARNAAAGGVARITAAAELYLTTSGSEYERLLLDSCDAICRNIDGVSLVIGRVVRALDAREFTQKVAQAVRAHVEHVAAMQTQNPYGVPYTPYIWGAGWGIQAFGARELFLHLGFPDIVPSEYCWNALSFILGCHPGENTASFVSGVGSRSLTVAYGANRDEWSYIPGGSASGTALIRPDLPELQTWPYFWQQSEYVLGGGTADFLLLAMAADRLLNK